MIGKYSVASIQYSVWSGGGAGKEDREVFSSQYSVASMERGGGGVRSGHGEQLDRVRQANSGRRSLEEPREEIVVDEEERKGRIPSPFRALYTQLDASPQHALPLLEVRLNRRFSDVQERQMAYN